MAQSVSDFFKSIDFFQIQDTFVDIGLYDYLFPYLLLYALFVTVFPYIKLFQKKNGSTNKPVVVLLSLLISLYGVSFEISSGQTIGMLLMNLFPNISALTIGIVALYIVGSILGVDFLKGLFRKDISANIYFTLAGLGLGMVVYFLGIAYGAWDYDPLDSESMWNVILALLFGILSIVFFIIKKVPEGLLFAIVVLSWIFGPQNESILMSFIDPFIFVLILFVFLLAWVNKGDDPKKHLAKLLQESKENIKNFEKSAGFKPKIFDSRTYDLTHQTYLNRLKEWEKKYGNENYEDFL